MSPELCVAYVDCLSVRTDSRSLYNATFFLKHTNHQRTADEKVVVRRDLLDNMNDTCA